MKDCHAGTMPYKTSPAFRPGILLLAGLLTGTLDILAACLQYYIQTGKGPGNVLRFIASGIWGADAFRGGNSMALRGLLLHFLIAFVFSALFLLFVLRLSIVRKNIYTAGILYGVFTWTVMNRLVLPLSAAPPLAFDPARAGLAILILVSCIGLPLAWISDKYYL